MNEDAIHVVIIIIIRNIIMLTLVGGEQHHVAVTYQLVGCETHNVAMVHNIGPKLLKVQTRVKFQHRILIGEVHQHESVYIYIYLLTINPPNRYH